MICPNCENKIPDKAKVCGYCGYKFKGAGSSRPQQVPMTPASRTIPGWIWGMGGVLLVLILGGILFGIGVITLPNNQEVASPLPATVLPQLDTVVIPTTSIVLDSRIVFESARDGDYDIYIMESDGTNLIQLTNDAGYQGTPVWSPDHSRIAFTSIRDGIASIYIMDSDGKNQKPLSNDLSELGREETPSWSPDGTRIVFNFYSNMGNQYDIYLMDEDGGNPIRLTEDEAFDTSPTWSPDSSQIAFFRCNQGNCAIYVMDGDGRNARALTEYTLIANGLDWSPDGRHIVFSRCFDRSNGCGILMMDNDGRNIQVLVDDLQSAYAPNWSGDGRQIIFGGSENIYVMNADGGNLRLLTYDGSWPDW